jgi:hypothetical protein
MTTTAINTLIPEFSFDTATSLLGDKVVKRSENEIRKYLSKRYDLSSDTFQTTTSTPPLIQDLCEQMATGYMRVYFSRGGKETIKLGWELVKEARDNLKKIMEYELDLFDSTGSIIADKSNTAYRVLGDTDDYTTTFNEDDPLDWAVDKDKLNDIESSERD